MTQSIAALPKDMGCEIMGWCLDIKDHTVLSVAGMSGMIFGIASETLSNGNTLNQMEKYGVSFECVIECCVQELEEDPYTLASIMHVHYVFGDIINDDDDSWNHFLNFSKSPTGRTIADMFIDKIRDCHNWEQLYDMTEPNSKFNTNAKKQIKEAIKTWLKT